MLISSLADHNVLHGRRFHLRRIEVCFHAIDIILYLHVGYCNHHYFVLITSSQSDNIFFEVTHDGYYNFVVAKMTSSGSY